MEFVHSLVQFDQYVFRLLNSQLSHPWLDIVMPILTDLHRVQVLTHFVGPLFLVLWLVRHKRKCLKTLLGVAFAVTLADSVSYHIIKKNVARERPERVMSDVIVRTHSHSGYSFPSNHGANIFASALIVRYMYPALRSFVFFIAILVAYSRVYVGVHFPLDVLAGSIVGYLCGVLTIAIGLKVQPESWKFDPPDFAKS